MPGSTYSTNLKVELMATGENSGTWGDITNTNLGTALEQAIVGYGNPNYSSDANLTISITNSNAAQAARALVLNVTSSLSLTATRELVVPTIQKQYIVQNNTTGSQSITVKTSAGTGITVPNGRKAHLYVNGTDVIQMFDFVDINGGAIDGTPIGASSASTGAFTTLNASGATTLDGNVTLGNASGDNVTVTGTITSNLLFTDNTYDIGASGATRPRNLFLAGAATIGGNLSVGGTLTLTGGLILNGNVTVGDSSADTLTVNATITSNLIFTDNTYDIGASGATRPRNLFLAGNATVGGNQTLTGSLTVDSTTDSSSTTTGSIQTDGGLGVAKAAYIGTTLNIGGLTSGRVAYVTTSGRITDSANLTFDGTTLTAANFADSSLTSGRVTYAGASGNLTDSGNLIFSGNQLSVQNSAAATGPTNPSYAISAVGGNNLIINLSANGEAYTLNTASAKYQYYQAGTVISVGTSYVSGTGSAALIDFNAYNSGGSATDLYLGAVSGPNANGAAIFVLGRRTGATSWAESLRIDENGGLSTTPAASGNTVFNENGVDSDFRVESDTDTHAFFLDAGNSRIGIGTSGPDSLFDVNGIATFGGTSAISTNGKGKISYFADDGGGDNTAYGNNVVLNTVAYTNTLNIVNTNHSGTAWVMGSLSAAYPNSVITRLVAVEAGGTNRDLIYATPQLVKLYSSNAERFSVAGSEVVVNDISADVDFRVESDGNAYAFFVDAGNNQVVIGSNTPVTGSASNIPLAVAYSYGPAVRFYSNAGADRIATCGISLTTYGDSRYSGYQVVGNGGGLWTNSSSGSSIYLTSNSSGTVYVGAFNQNPFENTSVTFTEYAIFNSGEVVFNDTSRDQDFRVESDTNTHALFVDAGVSKVGFNFSAPTNVLHAGVASAASLGSGSDGLVITATSGTGYNTQLVRLGSSYNYSGATGAPTVGAAMLYNYGGRFFFVGDGASASDFVFTTYGANRLQIGSDSYALVVNEDGLDYDFRVESDNYTHMLFVDAGNNSVSIGTSTAGPSSGLRVNGATNPAGGIVSTNLIAGFVATNYSGTRYWVLHVMAIGATKQATAFNCMGDVHASSYTTWNLSNLYIRREYDSYNVFGSITGVIKSSVTVSIVDISYNSNRYVAIKFAGGDPGIEANLVGYLMDQQYTNGTDAFFINGTAGVTENAVIATY